MCGRRARRRKTLAESYSTNQLVLAPHQKDEEQPRRVNNKHDEPYRVLPREVVRRRTRRKRGVEEGQAHRVFAGPRQSLSRRQWRGDDAEAVVRIELQFRQAEARAVDAHTVARALVD